MGRRMKNGKVDWSGRELMSVIWIRLNSNPSNLQVDFIGVWQTRTFFPVMNLYCSLRIKTERAGPSMSTFIAKLD